MIIKLLNSVVILFFFNDTATTEIYTLSLHDALPILAYHWRRSAFATRSAAAIRLGSRCALSMTRSEEHTSELQSQSNLVCRLLLEKKKIEHSDVLVLPDPEVLRRDAPFLSHGAPFGN